MRRSGRAPIRLVVRGDRTRNLVVRTECRHDVTANRDDNPLAVHFVSAKEAFFTVGVVNRNVGGVAYRLIAE